MAKDKMTTCKHCGQEIAASAKVCPHCGGKNKPPIYKRGWFIAIIVLVILYAIGSSGNSSNTSNSTSTSTSSEKAESSISSSSTVVSSSTEADSAASEVSSEASSEPVLSEDDYKAECETVKYKDLCRYPDQYIGHKITIVGKVQQIMDAGWLSNDKAWRIQTDNDGYGYYLDDEYYAIKVLQDDIVIIYGEFTGMTEVTRALTNTTDEIPCINVAYTDIVE